MPYWMSEWKQWPKELPGDSLGQAAYSRSARRSVMQPERFDVVVASNLFGDILSDSGPACTGTIGIARLRQPESGTHFPVALRAVHGSAPISTGKILLTLSPRFGPGNYARFSRQWR
ncbi:isocitrate/isopropylmalate family dehydrogenase [Escherichia coli]